MRYLLYELHSPVSITTPNSTAPHDALAGSRTWVTTDPGGFPSDYIVVAGAPVL